MVIIIIAFVRCIMTASGHHISEPAVHHALVDRKVDDGLLITVVNAGKSCLLGLSLHNLHLLDDLRRKVLCRELRVIKEEGLAVDRDLVDCLTVRCDGTVRVHLHTRKLLQEVLEHIVVGRLERRSIIFDSVLLDNDRISYGRDIGCIKDFSILLHLHDAKIEILLNHDLLLICLIAKQLGLKDICALPYLGKLYRSLIVGKNIFRSRLLSLDGQRGCSELYGFIGLCIDQFHLYGKRVLRESRYTKHHREAY